MSILASELFAVSQHAICKGRFNCYWCGAKCTEQFLAPPKSPENNRKDKNAKCPASCFICVGCWLFQRPSVTAVSLDEKTFKDRQNYKKYSLWITSTKTRVFFNTDTPAVIYETLLAPPMTFCMSLITDNHENMLQHSYVNQLTEIKSDTELFFTINNIKHSYTPYDLQKGLGDSQAAKNGGVSALIKLFGQYEELKEKKAIQGPVPSTILSQSKITIKENPKKQIQRLKSK